MKLIVEKPDGTRVAEIVHLGNGQYVTHTDDDSVRKIINLLIAEGGVQGLAHHVYGRQKTETGLLYQRSGRWLRPGDPNFLQALGYSLTHHDLFAYAIGEDSD
jgi:hypothetical protein